MYENLIKRLREAPSAWRDAELHYKAADAIETMNYELKSLYKLLGTHPDPRGENGEAGVKCMVLSKTERTTQWIPVTERLPKDGEFALVCNDDGHMMIAKHETETYEWYYKYTNYDFDIWDNEEQGPVRYWMPLPEPPKEE